MNRHFRIHHHIDQYEATLAVRQDEAEFIAGLIEEHAPRDAAGPEWRTIAEHLAAANGKDEE